MESSGRTSVLIVADDRLFCRKLRAKLDAVADDVCVVTNAEAALQAIAGAAPDALVIDIDRPCGGLDLIRRMPAVAPSVRVVAVTVCPTADSVSGAIAGGAVKVVVDPLGSDEIREVLGRIFDDRRVTTETPVDSDAAASLPYALIGTDPQMVACYAESGFAAKSGRSTLILGETGTGKENFARKIHSISDRSEQPFFALNCSALTETLLHSELFGHVKDAFTGARRDRIGWIAKSTNSFLLLDEIGDAPLTFQTALLRFLQDGVYSPVGSESLRRSDARIIAATNRDLEALIESGDFREDLYHRLAANLLRIPPLRERPGDILLIAEHLLAVLSTRLGRARALLADETAEALVAHTWPGNVRELENRLGRAITHAPGRVIRADEVFPPEREGSATAIPTLGSLDNAIYRHVQSALLLAKGNKSEAARRLGISRKRLYSIIGVATVTAAAHPPVDGAGEL